MLEEIESLERQSDLAMTSSAARSDADLACCHQSRWSLVGFAGSYLRWGLMCLGLIAGGVVGCLDLLAAATADLDRSRCKTSQLRYGFGTAEVGQRIDAVSRVAKSVTDFNRKIQLRKIDQQTRFIIYCSKSNYAHDQISSVPTYPVELCESWQTFIASLLRITTSESRDL